MDRKTFLCRSVDGLLGCCAALAVGPEVVEAGQQAAAAADPEKQFIQNWLADLMDALDQEADESVKVRLLSACGRACFERHEFKRNWAIEGRGDVDKLVTALKKNFEVWREGDLVHIRYGKVSKGCYCPAAKYRPAKASDIHCYCTRATHQAVWETALGRPIRVEIAETVRRGGQTCHFLVHLA